MLYLHTLTLNPNSKLMEVTFTGCEEEAQGTIYVIEPNGDDNDDDEILTK